MLSLHLTALACLTFFGGLALFVYLSVKDLQKTVETYNY